MPQVITPPSIGDKELESKNWYRAEALRKIAADLAKIYEDTPGEEVRKLLWDAGVKLAKAQTILAPPREPTPQPKPMRY